ncbi:hypothetical protein [Thiomicrospira microaerophila]|uniref:hypothetical protein n=1 Tax=Thiomicrospira microaerophila TaxID=406020 RepID=UPI0005C87692|nr:hypothetical protein [Thiomicrospira microaerophila]
MAMTNSFQAGGNYQAFLEVLANAHNFTSPALEAIKESDRIKAEKKAEQQRIADEYNQQVRLKFEIAVAKAQGITLEQYYADGKEEQTTAKNVISINQYRR